MPIDPLVARRDPKMRARIIGTRPLSYDPGTVTSERARHVRSGSGLAWTGEHLVVIHDGADCLAVIQDPGGVSPLPLRGASSVRRSGTPAVALESVLSAKDWRGGFLLAFGAGGIPERRCVARVRLVGGDTEMSVFQTRALYEALGQEGGVSDGAPVDIQGSASIPRTVEGRDGVRLFHHGRSGGEGTPRGYDATVDCRIDSLLAYLERCRRDPASFLGFDLVTLRHYDLDDYEGAQFHFTDASLVPGDGGLVAFSALARAAGEAGDVAAVALGVIEADGAARYTIVVERDGAVTRRVVQGLAIVSREVGYLVLDGGDEAPAELATVDLTGI